MSKTPALTCPVGVILVLLSGKWKTLIIHYLMGGTKRFNELRRLMPEVTQRMLTNQLRELESDGLVRRTVYPQVPPKVEYDLTDIGFALKPILTELEAWGACYLQWRANHLKK